MTCVFEEIMTEEESIIEGYHEKFRNAYYEDYKLDDETITELVEKHDVSDKIISHCGRGGWDALEELRPISEK